jgi:pilus assembly protein Flp/PilA
VAAPPEALAIAQSEALFMLNLLRQFLREEDGPTAVEYAVMLALIVAVCIASVNLMAHATADSFDNSAKKVGGVLN